MLLINKNSTTFTPALRVIGPINIEGLIEISNY